MNKIHGYYNELKIASSPEDMARRIIDAENAAPKRITLKRPAIIAAAAAAAMTVGVTAGAATGLFSFNDIFGSVSVTDDTFGDALLGAASNIKTTVSDDDYVVALKGVTGSPASLLASIEIYRADGQPINGLENARVDMAEVDFMNSDSFSGGKWYYDLNNEGTLNLDWEHRLDYDKLLDGELLVDGKVSLYGNVELEYNGDITPLEWTLDFDYTPSEESLRVARAVDTDENCVLCCSESLSDGRHSKLECDISDIVLTSTFGIFNGTVLDTESIMPCHGDDNDIKLIKSDGSEIKAQIASVGGDEDGNSFNFILRYSDSGIYTDELAVDLTEIKALSINGTVYELS